MTQSVIVYRNPIEAAFWESGLLLPLGVGLVVGIGVSYVCTAAWQRVWPNQSRMQNFSGHVALFSAIGGMIATMIYMV